MTEMTMSGVLDAMDGTAAGLTAPVPVNWTQGRTAYGGFSSALLLAAARHERPDLPPLRSALINFTGPVGEPPLLTSQVLRQGRNVTTIQARADIAGKTAALGTFSFGTAQVSELSQGFPAKNAPAPEDTEPFIPAHVARGPVAFFRNFDTRLIEGARPITGADRGYARVWSRHRDPAMNDRIEGLLSIADVLPPAVFPMLRTPGPNSSMNWICNVLTDEPRTRDGWWMIETDLTAAQGGYSSQVMRVWNSDGELVVDGMQAVVIFV